MIKLKNVSKYYYSKGMIASGITKVNLEFSKGEFVVITGESGSGKSTLLNVISGLDSYEEGEMYINGTETSHYLASDFEEYRKKYIGNIFQHFNLINSYTVYQNIELILLINGYKRAEVKERVHLIIKKVGLENWTRTKVSKLSGGQKQRVAIARALAKDTDIIVADEPTGNLDSVSSEGVVQLLSEISKDKLVIVVTHNYEQFKNYASRNIKMHDGKVVEDEYLKPRQMPAAEGEMPQFNPVAEAGLMSQQIPEPDLPSASSALSMPSMSSMPFGQAQDKDDTPTAHEPVKAVHSDENRGISPLSQFRLGIRNTFNIVAKFILLLIVFTFIVFAVTSQYTSYQHSSEEAKNIGDSTYFVNYSRDRIVLKKGDNSQFTEDDYKAIGTQSFVKSVAPYDILLDSILFVEDQEFSYQAYPLSVNEFKGKLVSGRMPEKDNEIILAGDKDDYYFSKEMQAQLIDKPYKINVNETKIDVTIVGFAYKAVPDGSYYTEGDMYVTDSIMNRMLSEIYNSNSTVVTTINGKAEENVSGTSLYKIVPSSKVNKGEAVVGVEVNNFYSNSNCKGNTISINAKNIFYSQTVDVKIKDTYEKKNLKDKTGQSDFDVYNGAIFVNQEDFNTLFQKGNFQTSVYVKDADQVYDNAKTFEKMGYVALPLQKVFTSLSTDILTIIQVPITVLIILAVFFIAYFVTRLILKSRSGYFSILRMLGLTKKKMKTILDIEMLAVVNIAYAVFLAVIILVNQHVIKFDYLAKLVEYMSGFDYLVLYIIVVLMAYLISSKFSRKLFKKTALGSFREED